MANTADELKLHYEYLKEAADALKKASEIRVNATLIVLLEKLYDEMGAVLDERTEAVKNEVIAKVGAEEANKLFEKYGMAN